MNFLLRVTIVFVFAVLFNAGLGSAKSLDIYNTLEAFPPVLSSLGDKNYDLSRLDKDEIPLILEAYVTALAKNNSQREKNLLILAIGYLHYLGQNYTEAINYLDQKIIGNFILEDFRIHYLSLALRDRGIQELGNQQYAKALNSFKRGEKLLLIILRSYPDSPFYSNVSRELAEVEYHLGQWYSQTLNHRTAWQAYRRSLMRDFPDNREHKLRVNLSLAENYRSAGDLESAADVYASILNTTHSEEAKETARNFFRVHRDRLKTQKIDFEEMEIDTRISLKKSSETNKRPIARKRNKVIYKNKWVNRFYESIDINDLELSLKLGLNVLKNVPGIQEARGVSKLLNHLLLSYLKDNPVNDVVDQLATLYPRKSLNKLAYSFWKQELVDQAAFFYEKIIQQYPLEINACHKALFFLGRIAEDKKEYSKALNYYEQLIQKYNFGSYTTAALFKIPWIHKLENRHDLALTHFDRLLEFYSSTEFKRLNATYHNASYKLAGQYWRALTLEKLGNKNEKIKILKELADNHPFDFYSIISREESGFDLKQFLTQKASQEVSFRVFGLGEIERKRLSRAEQLIAVGFRDYGIEELGRITFKKENPAFSFYIAHLFKLGRDFQGAMLLSWKIAGNGNHDRLSRSIAEGLYPKAFHLEVQEILKNYDLDPFLVYSLMRQESAFDPKIMSKANAIGLMQLMPKTAREVARSLGKEKPTEEQLKEPSNNVRFGIEYLNHLMVSFNQNIVYALAAYNAGPNKVKQWFALHSDLEPLEFIETIPYNETRNYVKKVLRNYVVYLTLYEDQIPDRISELLKIKSNQP